MSTTEQSIEDLMAAAYEAQQALQERVDKLAASCTALRQLVLRQTMCTPAERKVLEACAAMPEHYMRAWCKASVAPTVAAIVRAELARRAGKEPS